MTMDNKTWTATVDTDPETGEQVLVFPEDMLALLQWKEGDELDFDVSDDGTIVITKVE